MQISYRGRESGKQIHTSSDVVGTDEAAVHARNLALKDHVNFSSVIHAVDVEAVVVRHQVLNNDRHDAGDEAVIHTGGEVGTEVGNDTASPTHQSQTHIEPTTCSHLPRTVAAPIIIQNPRISRPETQKMRLPKSKLKSNFIGPLF